MSFIEAIINYIRYLWALRKLEVTEPTYVLPIERYLALKSMSTKGSWAYKQKPTNAFYLYSKVQLNKVTLSSDWSYKTVYSWWLHTKDLENREFLKYNSEDEQIFFSIMKETVTSPENMLKLEDYRVQINNIPSFKSLVDLLYEYKKDELKEYILDTIFKNYSSELFSLYKEIYTSNFSNYIQEYYKRLLCFSFQFQNFSELINYHNELELVQSGHLFDIKKRLLKFISDKSLEEAKFEEYRRLKEAQRSQK